jgi:hypothetical protein
MVRIPFQRERGDAFLGEGGSRLGDDAFVVIQLEHG